MPASSTDQMIQDLEAWIKAVAGNEKIYWDNATLNHEGLYLFAQGIHSEPWERDRRSFSIDVLIVPHFKKSFKALALIESLIFSALEDKPQELQLNPPHDQIWQQLETIARPSLTLKQTITRQVSREKATPVREPIHIRWKESETFEGQLLDHENEPLPFENIKIHKSKSHTQTDLNGKFLFSSVPSSNAFPDLVIRGQKISVQSSKYPALYQVNLLESPLNAEL